MGKINIATLNVRGLNNPEQRLRIFTMLNKAKYDFIFLTETHVSRDSIPSLQKQWKGLSGSDSYFSDNNNRTALGVAILLGNRYRDVPLVTPQISIPGRSVSIEIDLASHKHKLLCIYAPNIPTLRREFFEEITANESTTLPLIIGGDFNFVENPPLDRIGGSGRAEQGSAQLGIFRHSHQLCDSFRMANPQTKLYTFKGNQTPPAQSRIDRIYIPYTHLKNLKANITPIPNSYTDHYLSHCTFSIPQIRQDPPKGPGYWKLNASFLEERDFVEIMDRTIDDFIQTEADYQDVHEFWDCLKVDIKETSISYGKEKRRAENDVYNSAIAELQAEASRPNPNQNQIRIHNQTIENCIRHKTEGLILQTKSDEIEYSEKSNKYFFKLLKVRKKQNTLDELLDENGNNITCPQKILSQA